jgi:hypothetical protein
MWRADPAWPFSRDGGVDPPDLPAWFLDHSGKPLHPYASDDGEPVAAMNSDSHHAARERLKAGASHPARVPLLRMAGLGVTDD